MSTVVSFHAHPDDETLLTGGTLARAAAEGHRVVLVVATAGEAGLSDDPGVDSKVDLGARRRLELARSAAALGVARVEMLGYADSGLHPRRPTTDEMAPVPAPTRFVDAEPEEAAHRLAAILVEEQAEVLTTYDAAGGYGHPDHRQVHHVGRRAAQLAGTPVVLEATLDRTAIVRLLRPLRLARRAQRLPMVGRVLARLLPVPELPSADRIFTDRRELTHRVDVRGHLDAKRAALAAHASQTGGGPRTVSLLLALPSPLSRWVLGTEWFREVGRTPGGPLVSDIFA